MLRQKKRMQKSVNLEKGSAREDKAIVTPDAQIPRHQVSPLCSETHADIVTELF
jgi:hypothetical protein